MAALSLRYDHYSSQSLFEAACKRANLDDQESYTASEVAAFRAALAKLGDRLQRVDDRLDSLLGTAAPDANQPPAAAAKPANAPHPAGTTPPSEGDANVKAAPHATAPMLASEGDAKPEPAKVANAPQSTAPMSTSEGDAKPEPVKAASAPQSPVPMPASEAGSKPEPAKLANGPQSTAPMPASEGGSRPEPAKLANVPQSTAPMPASEGSSKPEPAKLANVPQSTAPLPTEPATPEPPSSTEAGETRIVLSGLELADGDTLFVCGDRVELGNWDPERARPMMRDGDAWIAVVPRGEGVFKFLRRTEDGDVTWEAGDNREIGMAAKIETSWQAPGSD